MPAPREIFPAFFVIWIALSLGGTLFFVFSKDLALKKALFPRLTIGAGVLFGLAVATAAPWPAALLFAPFIALISWLNIRMTRFCDACGRMLINQMWWSKMAFCPYCGTKLP